MALVSLYSSLFLQKTPEIQIYRTHNNALSPNDPDALFPLMLMHSTLVRTSPYVPLVTRNVNFSL